MRNYFVVLLRTLERERLYAAINITGLALGIACAVILGLFLRSELTFDRHHLNHERIFRVVEETGTNGSVDRFAITSRMLGPMFAADYPQIKAYVRFRSNVSADSAGLAIHHGNDTYYWKNSYFADDNVFDVFTHRIVYGDPRTALKEGGSLAVSETFARRYFGDKNPIGELVTTDSGIPNKITLVFADLPVNTHLKYDILFSGNVSFLRDADNPTERRRLLWGISDFTYLLVAPDFDPRTWSRMNDEFFKRYMEAEAKASSSTWRSWLQPLTATHLQSEVNYDLPNGNRLYLFACAAVALFILLVACANYTNLATARATRRARSVAIRKILGANRWSLALQFLGEALLFSLIALLLALVLVEVVMRFTPLNSLMGDEVSLNLIDEPWLVLGCLGLSVLVGLLSGAYPAFYLSSWAPLAAVDARNQAGSGKVRLRESLVLLQFMISAAVIACTLLIFAQMRYIANKSLGFQKENRLVVTLRGADTIEKLPTIRAELAKDAHILATSEALLVMGQETAQNLVRIDDNRGVSTLSQVAHMPISEDFVKVMGLKLVAGRDFSRQLQADIGTGFLVNEAMVRKMGWTNPLGKHITLREQTGQVIGVVGDFNFKSLRSPVEPFLMYPLSDDFAGMSPAFRGFVQRLLIVNISGSDVKQTLDYVEGVIARADSRHPFEYAFLDDQLDNLYKSEHRLTRLMGIFGGICIFIACLGLFGLASFTTEQRGREIATRKVLGASTWQIILLLSRRIVVLVLAAAVLASVISYFAIDEWLSGFTYHADINPLIFVASAVLAAFVAFTTVTLQAYKVANGEPVKRLRDT